MNWLLPGILLAMTISACSQKSESDKLMDGVAMPEEVLKQTDEERVKKAVDNAVRILASANTLYGEHIGVDGHTPEEYQLQSGACSYLAKWADTNRLVALTHHTSPLVRYQAFVALKGKKYTGIKRILQEHIDDRGSYYVNSGCTSHEEFVNACMFQEVQGELGYNDSLYFARCIEKRYGIWYRF